MSEPTRVFTKHGDGKFNVAATVVTRPDGRVLHVHVRESNGQTAVAVVTRDDLCAMLNALDGITADEGWLTPRPSPRIPKGSTRDVYINPAVTMFLRRDTTGDTALVVQPNGKPSIKVGAFVMGSAGLETLMYWLGYGPAE